MRQKQKQNGMTFFKDSCLKVWFLSNTGRNTPGHTIILSFEEEEHNFPSFESSLKFREMNKPELFTSCHGLTRGGATQVLSKYINSMTWKTGERIFDLGCGDGYVTSEVLLPRLPADFELLVGLDISPNMIKYATKTYRHPKQRFVEFDITQDIAVISEMWPEGFDKAFSFFCLHWIIDQRKAVSNIYNLLRTGGETLIVFFGACATYQVYELLAPTPQWKPYMKDYHNFITPYQHSSDPAQEFRKLMQDTGFEVIECECTESSYSFDDLRSFKDAMKAVNAFIDRIPKEQHEQYLTEIVTEMKNLHNREPNKNATDGIKCTYTLLVAYAKKT